MMDNPIKPEFLATPLEYETEFYVSSQDKWSAELSEHALSLHPGSEFSVAIDTSEPDIFDDLVHLDSNNIKRSLSAPVHRRVMANTIPVFIPSKSLSYQASTSHPPTSHHRSLHVVGSLEDHVLAGDENLQQNYSRLREALTAPSTSGPRNLSPTQPNQPVNCNRCGEELNSKCLVQACTKPDQTTCKVCGNEMTIKCILAVCKQE